MERGHGKFKSHKVPNVSSGKNLSMESKNIEDLKKIQNYINFLAS